MRAAKAGNHLTATIIDGKAVAAEIKSELKQDVAILKASGIKPGLGTLLVGNDAGSMSYVAGKHRDCAEVGIESIRIDLPASASESDIRMAIKDLNSSAEVSGYIVQLPLPNGIEAIRLLSEIDPSKDADGLHPENLGKLVLNISGEMETPMPCTPSGILELIRRFEIPTRSKKVAILGRGITVGRPLSLMMTRRGIDATVTILHSASENIEQHLLESDIIVAAVGVPHFVTPAMVGPGAAVFDVGITRVEGESKATLLGDVDPAVIDTAGFFSPNPGGVGPMTRAMLLVNVVKLARVN